MDWAQQEFETIDLSDLRLSRRAALLTERLGQKPAASILTACENWAETAVAYRFLRNEQVRWDTVMNAHCQSLSINAVCLEPDASIDSLERPGSHTLTMDKTARMA